MEQPPSCSCFTIIFTVLQEALLILAVNPATKTIPKRRVQMSTVMTTQAEPQQRYIISQY